ncbi:MAG: MFS transporter [Desulfohalobiaceae bacterium]|nr:MFS transporter [Desulfohalobiaceae bacterium]
MKINKKILGLLGTGHAVTDVNQGVLPMMLAYLQPVFAMSQLQVGLAMLVFNVSSSVIQPAFGIFSDRIRATFLIPLGCLLAGLGIAFTGISPNYPVMLPAVLVSGLGIAAYHPEGSKFARYSSGENKATGMSVFSIGGNIGFAAGPLLASLLFGLFGLRGSMGMLALNGGMALLLWIYLSGIVDTEKVYIEHANWTQDKEHKKSFNIRSKKVIIPVVLLTLVVIIRSWVHFGMVTYLPQYYINYLGQSERFAAVVTTVFLIAGAGGTLVAGPVADRIGLKNVILGSMFVLGPLLYLFTLVSGYWVMVLVALLGFVVVSTFAITVVFSHELLPYNVGLASGITMGFGIGMGGVGTTVLGWVADIWGLPAVFQVMIFLPVLALLLTLFLPKR